eukprot:m.113833 g.113833  ORF g.113833 m.113833 type:complete len:79 (-) comp13528_c0_seq2:1105-1341(-)
MMPQNGQRLSTADLTCIVWNVWGLAKPVDRTHAKHSKAVVSVCTILSPSNLSTADFHNSKKCAVFMTVEALTKNPDRE